MGVAALILLGLFSFVILVPCIGTAILGVGLLKKIGRYPSKTPAFQISTFMKLAVLEIISFGMMAMLYHILTDYGNSG